MSLTSKRRLFPRRTSDLTAEWMTGALQEAGLLSNEHVEAVEVERLSQQSGYIGRVYRLTPSYDSRPDALPDSFALKVPSAGPEIRDRFRASYEREHHFYAEFATEAPVRVPTCYWNEANAESGDFALLLEDLSHLQLGERAGPQYEDEPDLVVQSLARLHAHFWGVDVADDRPWLRDAAEWRWGAGTELEQLRACVDTFIEFYADLVPPDFGSVLLTALAVRDLLVQPLPGVPKTLIHGDFRSDNMFLDRTGREDELVIFDWQFTSVGVNRWDLCYYLAHNLPVELRRARDVELVRLYHSTLVESGVSGYSFDECMEDYRIGLLLTCFQPLGMERARLSNIRQLEEMTGERRDLFERSAESFSELQRTMAERNIAAVSDHEVADSLLR